ncbi:TPA: hypothetical protein QIF36_004165 [Enterobacter kobei]|nr:hypothetical protein [Enterobacter kobei]
MMNRNWIANLLPSLLIGLIVGGAATWQVESSLQHKLKQATLNNPAERQRLIHDIAVASANEVEVRLKGGCLTESGLAANDNDKPCNTGTETEHGK